MNSVFFSKIISSDNIEYTPQKSLGEIPLLDAANEGFAIYQKLEKEDLHYTDNRYTGFDYIDTFFITKVMFISGEKNTPRIIRIRNYKDQNNITGDEDGYTCQIHDITLYIDPNSNVPNNYKDFLLCSIKASELIDKQYFLGSLEYDIPDLDDSDILTEDSYNKIIDIKGMVIGHLPSFGSVEK